MQEPANYKKNILKRTFSGLLLCFMLLAYNASAQVSTNRNTQNRQRDEFRTKARYYLSMIDSTYTDSKLSDTYREKFLDEAVDANSRRYTIAACKEICNSYNYNLIDKAINIISKQPKNNDTQSILTLLKCHSYWRHVNSLSKKEMDAELKQTLTVIYRTPVWKDPFEEYYVNFKAFRLHGDIEIGSPVEPYVMRMYRIAGGIDETGILSHHVTRLATDMFIRTSQFEQAKRMCNNLANIQKAEQERLKREGRSHKMDITDYTTTMRMLICELELNHKVDSTLMQSILPYGKMEHAYNSVRNERALELYPLLLALYEKRNNDAGKLADKLIQKDNGSRYMFDFEYDACVYTYKLTEQYEKAIDVTEKQIKRYEKLDKILDELYREEMGLNAEWEDFERQNRLLQIEKQTADYNTEFYRKQLEDIIRQHTSDSLLYAKTNAEKQKSLKAEQNINETVSNQAKDERKNLSQNIILFSLIFIAVVVLMLVLLIPYIVRIRKINLHLTKEHKRLIKVTDKANQSNRLKVFFLQNTSHDIRNPLGAIDNLSTMMSQMVQMSNDENLNECAKEVSKNSLLLTRMMNNILDISAIESGRYPIVWEDTYPVGIVQEIIVAREATAEKPIEIKLESELPEDYMLRSDNKRIRQLLRSLVNNAWKFTDKGHIIIRLCEEDNQFVATVEDTGRGIQEEYSEKVFQRFFKIDEFVPGTGMGLSLSKVIAENLQATLVVDTSYKEGARFVFRQPLNAEEISEQKRKEEYEKMQGKKSSMGVKAGIIALLLALTPTLNTDAQIKHTRKTYDSLKAAYNTAKTDEERLPILYNLMDISSYYAYDSIEYYTEKLYELGKKMKRQDVMLTACRNALNESKVKEMLHKIDSIPDSNDKKCTRAFLKVYGAQFQILRKSIDEKRGWIQEQIVKLEREKTKDPFERYVALNCICYAATGIEQSQMIKKYLDELENLAPKLQQKKGFLCSPVFQTAYTYYMSIGDHVKAKNAILNLMSTMDIMEGEYHKQNRLYRGYDLFRLRFLADLYFCQEAINEQEKQDIYDQITEIERKEYSTHVSRTTIQKIRVLKAIHEGNWERAAQVGVSFTRSLDAYLKEQSIILDENSIAVPHIDLLAKVFEQTGMQQHLLITRIIHCELLRRIISNTKKYNYLHYNINQRILDAKLQQAQTLADNERKQLEYIQLQTDYERNQWKIEREKQRNYLESLRLDSLTKETIAHKEVMEKQVESSQHASSKVRLILFVGACVVGLITLIVAAVFANRLRMRREVLRLVKKQLASEMERAKESDKETTAFLKSIRHEVGTPLNIIMGMSKQIASMVKEQDSEEMKMLSDMINANGEQLLSLINDILDLSLIQSGEYNIKLKEQKILTLCDMVSTSVMHHFPPNVELVTQYNIAPQSTIFTDEVRFKQVLTNLFTNACKYTESGSITLSVTRKGNMYEFAVADTGCGINPENAQIIFERFEKLGSKKQGTGLGLNISRTIVNKLGGELKLDTSYTKGAKFVFTHPITPKE